jgi:hypothetical protein
VKFSVLDPTIDSPRTHLSKPCSLVDGQKGNALVTGLAPGSPRVLAAAYHENPLSLDSDLGSFSHFSFGLESRAPLINDLLLRVWQCSKIGSDISVVRSRSAQHAAKDTPRRAGSPLGVLYFFSMIS